MVLKLYDTDISHMIMEKECPETFSVQHDGGIEERSVCVDFPTGKGSSTEIYFEGVHMEYNMNISEVSDAVGYQNPRHFSSAFKKKFGILPSQVKRRP